jgi:hypothetical protein
MNVRQESKNQQIAFSIEITITKRNFKRTFKVNCKTKHKTTMLCGCGPVFNKIMGQVIKKEDSHTVIQSDV